MPESSRSLDSEPSKLARRILERTEEIHRKALTRALIYKVLDNVIMILIIIAGVIIVSSALSEMLELKEYIALAGSLVTILQFTKSLFKLESLGRRYQKFSTRLNELGSKVIQIELGISNRQVIEEILQLSREFDDINLRLFHYQDLHREALETLSETPEGTEMRSSLNGSLFPGTSRQPGE